MTCWQKDKRPLIDLVSFLFDRLDDDEAAARALLTPSVVRQSALADGPSAAAPRGGPVRALREVTAKRIMVAMWFAVHAELFDMPVPGLDVADAMIVALVTVYADHPRFDPDWLADAEQPDRPPCGELDNVVELHPGQP